MGTWKRARRASRKEGHDRRELLARRIAGCILSRQYRLASFLNRKARRATRRQQLVFFWAFLLVIGGYCLYLILRFWI